LLGTLVPSKDAAPIATATTMGLKIWFFIAISSTEAPPAAEAPY
jgi:hypothetical protein